MVYKRSGVEKDVWAYAYVHIYDDVYAINHMIDNLRDKINILKHYFIFIIL